MNAIDVLPSQQRYMTLGGEASRKMCATRIQVFLTGDNYSSVTCK